MLTPLICCGITDHDMERLCIYPNEAAELLGITERQAQRKFRAIRFEMNKKKGQYITIKDFSDYTGIPEEVINAQLRKSK